MVPLLMTYSDPNSFQGRSILPNQINKNSA